MKKTLFILLLLISRNLISNNFKPFWKQSPEKAQAILKSMTLKGKIGQLFMLGIYSYDNDPDKEMVEILITEYHLGGFMFMYGSVKRQIELVKHYQKISKLPLIFSQDNEWGRVQRLPKELIKFPDSMTIGAIEDNSLAYEVGEEFANRCKSLGVGLNFAPVMDTNSNPLNPIIGPRSFGENKENVVLKGCASIKGMQDNRVIACAKHFPGHGDTEIDSHLDFPTVNKIKEELDKLELYPFKKAIEAEIQSIMTAHINFSQIGPGTPATLSYKFLTGILRNELGFEGLIITDIMNMKGITKLYPSLDKASLRALLAGNDIILFGKARPESAERFNEIVSSIECIYNAVQDEIISEEQIDEHVLRILMAKEWLGLFENREINTDITAKNINSIQAKELKRRLYENAVTLVKNDKNTVPLSTLETYPTALIQIGGQINSTFARELKNYCNFSKFFLNSNSEAKEIQEVLENLNTEEVIIIALFDLNRFSYENWGISHSTLNLLENLKAQKKNILLTIFGNPYSLKNFEDIDAIIMAYEDEREAQTASAKIIGGKLEPSGKLPVTASKIFREGLGLNT
ncbi:glycoside hydrolase family 3 C-terminal domain-containing protein [Candidatus Babeliales bacterium]|nr:glycoside hydrolase family 3 C-terminal domain-containing protein [Candidatus Babeliales bacterium]